MNGQKLLCVFSILLAVFLCWGCSGQKNEIAPTSDGSDAGQDGQDQQSDSAADQASDGGVADEDLSQFDAINAAIEAVRSQLLEDLKTLSLAQAYQAAANLMNSLDIVTHVDLVTDPWISFSVEFANGVTYGMPVYRVTPAELERIRQSKSAPSPKPRSSDLPVGRAAIFMKQSAPLNLERFAALANSYGYQAQTINTVAVDSFRNLDRFALVYFHGHGSYFLHKEVWYYGLLTDDPETPLDNLKYIYSGDFQSLRVRLADRVYIVENENPWITNQTEYVITDQFIIMYSGDFGTDSLVYINACSSTKRQDTSVLPPMTFAFALHGVNAYLGWNNFVTDVAIDQAGEYLWSRLLGEVPAGFYYLDVPEPPEPPIRPYGLNASLMALEAKGWHKDDYYGLDTTLEIMDLNYGDHDILLRPQISSLSVDVDIEKQTHSLSVQGDFGHVSGTVHRCPIDVVPNPTQCPELSVDSWSNDEIEIEMDTKASEDNGYIVVVVDGRYSNPHPLTQWKARFTVNGSLDNPGPDVNVVIDARFLAEILRERPKPDDMPMDAFGMAVGEVTLDSNVHWAFSGEFTDARYRYEYPADHATNKGDMSPKIDGDTGWNGSVTLNPGKVRASFQIIMILKAFYNKYDIQTNQLIESQTIDVVIPVHGDAVMSVYGDIKKDIIQELPYLKVKLDSITAETQPSQYIPH